MKYLTLILLTFFTLNLYGQNGAISTTQLPRSDDRYDILVARDSLSDIDRPYFMAHMSYRDLLDSLGIPYDILPISWDELETQLNSTARETMIGNINPSASVDWTIANSNFYFRAQAGVTDTLYINFSDGYHPWPVADSIAATWGTATVGQRNYVYIPQSTKILTVSTAGWPSTEHARLADIIVKDETYTNTYGPLKYHAWTDHNKSSVSGHLGDINAWIRSQSATLLDGLEQSVDVVSGSPDTIRYELSSGNVLQLHKHGFDALEYGDTIFVSDWLGDEGKPINYLSEANIDTSGTTLNGKYYHLVTWGVVNEQNQDCKIFVNLPFGSYNTEADALQDLDGYTNCGYPAKYRGTAFPISKIVVRHQTSGGGTFTIINHEDIRAGGCSGDGSGNSMLTLDHGALTGLTDNDHPHYYQQLTESGDTLYLNEGGFVYMFDNDFENELSTLHWYFGTPPTGKGIVSGDFATETGADFKFYDGTTWWDLTNFNFSISRDEVSSNSEKLRLNWSHEDNTSGYIDIVLKEGLQWKGGNDIARDTLEVDTTYIATRNYVDAVDTSHFQLNGTALSMKNQSWNLGIGTVSPISKLHVQGDSRTTGVHYLGYASSYINGSESWLQYVNGGAKDLIFRNTTTGTTYFTMSGGGLANVSYKKLRLDERTGTLATLGGFDSGGYFVESDIATFSDFLGHWKLSGDHLYNLNPESVTVGGPYASAYTTKKFNIIGDAGMKFLRSDGITEIGNIERNASGEMAISGGNNTKLVLRSLDDTDNDGIVFRNKANTDLMFIERTGNVGIGTTSPNYQLQIGDASTGSTISNTKLYLQGDGGASSTDLQNRLFVGLNNNQGYGSYLGHMNTDYSTGQIAVLGTRSGGTDYPALFARAGNVGIGTPSPESNLHVFSAGNAVQYIERSGGAKFRFQAQSNLGRMGTVNNFPLNLDANAATRVSISTVGEIQFLNYTGTSFENTVTHLLGVDNSTGIISKTDDISTLIDSSLFVQVGDTVQNKSSWSNLQLTDYGRGNNYANIDSIDYLAAYTDTGKLIEVDVLKFDKSLTNELYNPDNMIIGGYPDIDYNFSEFIDSSSYWKANNSADNYDARYYESEYDFTHLENTATAGRLSTDGLKAWATGNGSDSLFQFNLSTPWETETQTGYNSIYLGGNPHGFDIKGYDLLWVDYNADSVHHWRLNAFEDISQGYADLGAYYAGFSETNMTGIWKHPTQNRYWVIGLEVDGVTEFKYDGDIENSVNVQTGLINLAETSFTDLGFTDDGHKVETYGNTLDSMYYYDLDQPYDISTATKTRSESYLYLHNGIQGFHRSLDKSHLYFIDWSYEKYHHLKYRSLDTFYTDNIIQIDTFNQYIYSLEASGNATDQMSSGIECFDSDSISLGVIYAFENVAIPTAFTRYDTIFKTLENTDYVKVRFEMYDTTKVKNVRLFTYTDNSELLTHIEQDTVTSYQDLDPIQVSGLTYFFSLTNSNLVQQMTVPDQNNYVQEGADIDITGTGTSGDPWVFNSTFAEIDGSLTNEGLMSLTTFLHTNGDYYQYASNTPGSTSMTISENLLEPTINSPIDISRSGGTLSFSLPITNLESIGAVSATDKLIIADADDGHDKKQVLVSDLQDFIDTDTDNQTLSIASNNLSISSGNSVSLSPYLDNTDNQSLSYSGYGLGISSGTGVTLPFFNDTGSDWYSSGEFGFGVETNPIYALHMSGLNSSNYEYFYFDDYTGFIGEDNSAGSTGMVWTRGGNGMRWETPSTGTDNQNLLTTSWSGTTLTIPIENGASTTASFTNFQTGPDLVNDADSNPTNEIQTIGSSSITGGFKIELSGTATDVDLTGIGPIEIVGAIPNNPFARLRPDYYSGKFQTTGANTSSSTYAQWTGTPLASSVSRDDITWSSNQINFADDGVYQITVSAEFAGVGGKIQLYNGTTALGIEAKSTNTSATDFETASATFTKFFTTSDNIRMYIARNASSGICNYLNLRLNILQISD